VVEPLWDGPTGPFRTGRVPRRRRRDPPEPEDPIADDAPGWLLALDEARWGFDYLLAVRDGLPLQGVETCYPFDIYWGDVIDNSVWVPPESATGRKVLAPWEGVGTTARCLSIPMAWPAMPGCWASFPPGRSWRIAPGERRITSMIAPDRSSTRTW